MYTAKEDNTWADEAWKGIRKVNEGRELRTKISSLKSRRKTRTLSIMALNTFYLSMVQSFS